MSEQQKPDYNTVNKFMAIGSVIGIILGVVTGLIFDFTAFWIAAGIALGISGGAAIEGVLHSPKKPSH